MSWSTPATPNLPDYILFVQSVMAIDPLYLPFVAAPFVVGLTVGSAGSLPSGVVYVRTTYVSALGETNASPEASVMVTGPTAQVTVASPPTVTGATGYNVYAALASGGEQLQNTSAPVAIGTPTPINAVTSGRVFPTVNTASSPWLSYALERGKTLVLQTPVNGGVDYTLAVYNCAGHVQLRITPDQTGRTFFQDQRATFELLKQSVGLVQSTSDQGTASSFAVSDAMSQLTISDLDFMRTPWGREYLAYVQDFGGLWGLT